MSMNTSMNMGSAPIVKLNKPGSEYIPTLR